MKYLQMPCLVVAFSIAAASQINTGDSRSAASSEEAAEMDITSALPSTVAVRAASSADEPLPVSREEAQPGAPEKTIQQLAAIEPFIKQQAITKDSVRHSSVDATPLGHNFSYLAYYAFSEIPPEE